MAETILRMRWLLLTLGVFVAVGSIMITGGRSRTLADALRTRLESSREWAGSRYRSGLWVLFLVWFTLAASAKFLQLQSLELNSQDFWLFEDMLRSLRDGAFLLTRFAPQMLGPVQHGAIHTTFAWAL